VLDRGVAWSGDSIPLPKTIVLVNVRNVTDTKEVNLNDISISGIELAVSQLATSQFKGMNFEMADVSLTLLPL
jgi:hypothetical protein